MVSIDIYINETTRHADLILPPASPLTQTTTTSCSSAFAVRRVARFNAALRERGAHERADWEIVNGLGAALLASGRKAVARVLRRRALIAAGLAQGDSGLDLATLRGRPHGRRPPGAARALAARRPLPLRADATNAPAGLLDELARFAARDRRRATGAWLLIGRRDVRSNNSWMHNAPRLAKGKPRHQLLMHPDDMAARGLRDGMRVRVRSRVGAIETDVLGDAAAAGRVACLPHGFGHGRAGVRMARAAALPGESYNDLTDALASRGRLRQRRAQRACRSSRGAGEPRPLPALLGHLHEPCWSSGENAPVEGLNARTR
jgi:anaerobic selenocysteine-containing dehydrogenase